MELSPPAGKTELLFFEPRPTQVQILNGSWREVRPMQSLTSGPIIFRIPASSEAVIDLSRTFLYVKARILRSSGATTAYDKPTQEEVTRLSTEATRLEGLYNTATGTLETNRTAAGDALTQYNTRQTALNTAQTAEVPDPAAIALAQTAFNTQRTAWQTAENALKNQQVTASNALLAWNEAKSKHTSNQSIREGNFGDNLRVAPVVNTLHSLFSSVDLSINERQVSGSSGTYPYKAYLARLLSASRDAIDSQFQNAMFYPEAAGFFPPVETNFNKPTDANTNTNLNMYKRHQMTSGSQEFELIDTLFIDLANQEKLLIPGLNLVLTLNRSDPKFALMSVDERISYRIDITECVLYVRTVEVAPIFLLETEQRLQNDTAKYYFQRMEVSMLPLNVSQTVVNESNLTLASPALPNRIVMAMVDTEASAGTYGSNPFQFELFNLAAVNFFFNGQALPYRRPLLTTDRVPYTSLQAYYSLFSQTGLQSHPMGSSWISREDWARGYAIQCFEFTPDGSVGEHLQLSRGGVLNLEMRFATPLGRSITVILLSIYDSYLQFTGDRNVIANFIIT